MNSTATKLKTFLLLAFLTLGYLVNAQNVDKLKPYFHKLVYIDKANVYSGTELAKDGEKYSTITINEAITGIPVTWSDPNPRKSLLDKEHGLSHNRNTPIFKKPVGDTPHLFWPNCIGSQLVSGKFAGLKTPNTVVTLTRVRDAVTWEGGIGSGVSLRDRGDHIELSNNAAGVQIDKGVFPRNRWILTIAEDNGGRSRVLINDMQIGGFVNLPPSYIDAIWYGTNSHIIEHDLKFFGIYNGIYTDAQLAELIQIANKIVPLGSYPKKAFIYSPRISISNGVASVSSYKFHGYDQTPIDPNSIVWEWMGIDAKTGLDGQRFLGSGPTLTIPADIVEVSVIGFCKDMKGRYYSGVPFRSEPARK